MSSDPISRPIHTPPPNSVYPSRSCLKRSQTLCAALAIFPISISLPDRNIHTHVHFPPTPYLHQTFPTHSKRIYDRTPLTVFPNECAIPARGAPGRTYVDNMIKDKMEGDDYEDVEALHAGVNRDMGVDVDVSTLAIPQLVPDQGGSSSDESDSVPTSSFLISPDSTITNKVTSTLGSMNLGFLPHAPVRGTRHHGYRYQDRNGSYSHSREISEGWQCQYEGETEALSPLELLQEKGRERLECRKENEEGRWKLDGLRGIFPVSGGIEIEDDGCFGGF